MPEYSESETVAFAGLEQREIPYSGNSEKMNYHPLVTVVVVNYNGRHFIRECLASITNQTYAPLEVILVDNASSDGSVEFVRALFPGIHIVQNNENRGFSGGQFRDTGIEWNVYHNAEQRYPNGFPLHQVPCPCNVRGCQDWHGRNQNALPGWDHQLDWHLHIPKRGCLGSGYVQAR